LIFKDCLLATVKTIASRQRVTIKKVFIYLFTVKQ